MLHSLPGDHDWFIREWAWLNSQAISPNQIIVYWGIEAPLWVWRRRFEEALNQTFHTPAPT
jgi:hypothetical protein